MRKLADLKIPGDATSSADSLGKIPSYLNVGEVRHPFADLPSEREYIVRRYSVVRRVLGASRILADVVARRGGKQGRRAADSTFRL